MPTDAAIPERIGQYLIREKIGSGGMATVYRATNPADGSDVAIKVLSLHLVDHATVIKRFEREGHTLLDLKHPNILPVYELGHEGTAPYIVMKLLNGRTLQQLLQGVPLRPEQAATFTRQIAGALDYAHARGVIHRDIKPSNILLDGRGKPYLADFGIAYDTESGSRLTLTGDFIGTAAYASPEQCRGEPITGASDIYSLGVVAYEMLTGVNPFQAPSSLAMMKKHMAENPPNPLAINPRLPIEVYAVLLMALAKLPQHRFQAAIRFSEALDGALHINRVESQPDDDMAWLVDRQFTGNSAARTVPSGTEQATPHPEIHFTDLEFETLPEAPAFSDLTFAEGQPVESAEAGPAADDFAFVLPEDLQPNTDRQRDEDHQQKDEFVIPEVETDEDPFAEPAPAPAAIPRRSNTIRPIQVPPRPAPVQPAKTAPKKSQNKIMLYTAAAVIVLIAAVGILIGVLNNKDKNGSATLGKSYADAGLGVRFGYPADWEVDTSHDPVLPTHSPYTLTLFDPDYKIALELERIDPVAVYGIEAACQEAVSKGPEATFGCMAANQTITPAYKRFNNRLYDGVELHGSLPPTNAMWPMVLLNLNDGDWLAVIITRWSDYADAYTLLEDIARSVKPLE